MRLKHSWAWTNPVYAFEWATGNKIDYYQEDFLLDDTLAEVIVKSRSIGFSVIMSFRAFWRAWKGYSKETIIIATGDRVTQHLRDYITGYISRMELDCFVDRNTHDNLKFTNGSTIYFLPQSSAGNLGYHGDIYIDEAAHLKDGERILGTLMPMAVLGSQIRVCSTPFGQDKLFFALCNNKHFKKIELPWTVCPRLSAYMPALGCSQIDFQKSILSDSEFQQEYCGAFLAEVDAFISPDRITDCTDPDLPYWFDTIQGGRESEESLRRKIDRALDAILMLKPQKCGWDVGIKKDKSELVFVIFNAVGTVIPVANLTLEFMPIPVQEYLMARLSKTVPTNVDRGLYGTSIIAHAADRGACRGYQLNPSMKAKLAEELKMRFDKKQIMLPFNRELKLQIQSIKRYPGSKFFKYDPERDENHHGDKFWALALASMKTDAPKLIVNGMI